MSKKITGSKLPEKADGQIDWKEITEAYKQNANGDSVDLNSFVFGKLPPQAADLEEAVLGACLFDNTGYPIAAGVFMGENPFYAEKHKHVWNAMRECARKLAPIDMLTITEMLRIQGKLEAVGGAYELALLTNRVTSATNIEYHARIILQKYMSRRIINLCSSTLRTAYEDVEDVFEIFSKHMTDFSKVDVTNAMIDVQAADAYINDAINAETSKQICGSFLKTGGILFLFAEPKVGKSIFAVQIADALSKGNGIFNNMLNNEVGAQKVLYFDFELSKTDWKSRYSVNGSAPYEFSKDFIRAGESPDFVDYDKFAAYITFELQQKVTKYAPDVLIIDNITYMAQGSTADAEVAMKIMRILKSINKKNGTSIVVLAHTPKRISTQPLTRNDLAGSSHLANFCTDIVAIGKSNKEKGTVYLKHILSRSGRMVYDEENVIWCKIDKEANPSFLQYVHLGNSHEDDHLASFLDKESHNDLMREVMQMYNKNESLRSIKTMLKLDWSITTISTRIKEYQNSQQQYELQKPPEEYVMMSQATQARKDMMNGRCAEANIITQYDTGEKPPF